MKTIKFLILILTVIVVASSCSKKKFIKGSGDITEIERTVTDFNKVDISDAFIVDVNYSDTEELVIVEADDNLHKHIIIEVDNNRLVIRTTSGLQIRGKSTMKIHITTKELNSFIVNDASDLTLNDALETTDVEINLSDASTFEGVINATSGIFDLNDASKSDISGTIQELAVNASDASKIRGFDLVTDNLTVNVSDASNLELTVNNELRVTASDASHVKYKGTGVIVSQIISDASSVKKVD